MAGAGRRATSSQTSTRSTRYRDERWKSPINVGDIVPAVVAALGKPAPAGAARLIIGPYHADLARDAFTWTRRTAASDLVSVGDLIDVQIKSLDEETKTAVVSLEQTPVAEAALLVLDNRTGQVKAMVGGWDFQRSKFNRAVQAYRQLGSTFKPIVYTAAIDRGFTPASIIIDSPVAYPSGNGGTWAPQNYDHTFLGPITLRYAVEESRNIPAIKMMEEIGPKSVLDYAKRFGFEEDFPPYLPIALGAGDATLMEVTSAYTAFANQGMRMKPWSIINVKDREGNLLEQNRAEPTDVIGADSAYVMTNILRGVLSPRGTGARAAQMAAHWPLAGKTGTVDNNTDAWFIGFDPDITVGVWIGLDDKRKSLGGDEQGAKAALPIWMDFMQAYIDQRPDKDTPPDFQPPGNIVFLAVDKSTGAAATTQEAPGAITDAFIAGTEPGGTIRHPAVSATIVAIRLNQSSRVVSVCPTDMTDELWTSGPESWSKQSREFHRPKGTARSGRALPPAGRERTGDAVDQRRRCGVPDAEQRLADIPWARTRRGRAGRLDVRHPRRRSRRVSSPRSVQAHESPDGLQSRVPRPSRRRPVPVGARPRLALVRRPWRLHGSDGVLRRHHRSAHPSVDRGECRAPAEDARRELAGRGLPRSSRAKPGIRIRRRRDRGADRIHRRGTVQATSRSR